MSGQAPWWASDGPDGAHGADDPLQRHLDARRGVRSATGAGHPQGGPERGDTADAHADAASASGAARDGDTAPGASGRSGRAHDPEICGVCPICRGWDAVAARRPEVAEHLAEAARAMATALTHLADAATAAGRATGTPDPGGPDHSGSGSGGGAATGTATPDGFRPILLDDVTEPTSQGAAAAPDDPVGPGEESA